MLDCQRHLFALDEGVTFFNAASYAPMSLAVQKAGEHGVADKVRPWRRDAVAVERNVEETRRLAAGLIGAAAGDIAITCAASYGVATACANLRIEPRSRILMIEGEHSSLMLGLGAYARQTGAELDIVARPSNHDWTSAVLERLSQKGLPPIAIAALTPAHWTDGTIIDLERVVPKLRRQGAAILIDATQVAGVMPLDVGTLRPDFLTFPTYKWLLGPYGIAFLYVAPWRQSGVPLEQHAFNRAGYDSTAAPTGDLPYLDGARRFDRGERDSFITIPMAHAALRLIDGWTPPAIAARLRMLTDRLADALGEIGFSAPPRHLRAPHILGLRLAKGDVSQLASAMEAAGFFASVRHGVLRLSPHVYNDEADIDRLAAWMRERGSSSQRFG